SVFLAAFAGGRVTHSGHLVFVARYCMVGQPQNQAPCGKAILWADSFSPKAREKNVGILRRVRGP
ncbi:MAG TPA: hypothetical protein VK604_26560, partial [Bryobacteraceae bacterium]|nr:hypothetical protein [Bryobacteraceae bacterium]